MQVAEQNSQPSLWLRYVLFVIQFLGAGFVAGSVVHFGEGVTTWDVGVLSLGLILFTFSLVYKETQLSDKKMAQRDLILLVVSSLFLSLTIGMASGGTQHFIDTPMYAAFLIPAGLSLGFVAFSITQRARFSLNQWGALLVVLALFAVVFHILLLQFNRVIPDSIRRGHGSENHGTINDNTPALDLPSNQIHADDDVH